MISMYMLGEPSQIDLFDPKPELVKRNGENFSGDLKFDNAAQASREILGPGSRNSTTVASAAWNFRNCCRSSGRSPTTSP